MPLPGETTRPRPADLEPDSWEKQPADESVFRRVFGEAIDALEGVRIPYALIGGVASAALGRPRYTQDVDLLVRPTDAELALNALSEAGFSTQRTNEHWLYKGVKDGVLIDLIFRVAGDIYLDDDMLERSRESSVEGRTVRVVSPEDLLVVKAAVTSEEVPHHWHDALGLLATCEFDWEYLLRRARFSARRVLSLLVYAETNDLIVPAEVIRKLVAAIYGPKEDEA